MKVSLLVKQGMGYSTERTAPFYQNFPPLLRFIYFGVEYSIKGENIQDRPRRVVETSQRSSLGHFVSLYGLSTSIMVMRGMSFSLLMYYNEAVMRFVWR